MTKSEIIKSSVLGIVLVCVIIFFYFDHQRKRNECLNWQELKARYTREVKTDTRMGHFTENDWVASDQQKEQCQKFGIKL